MRRVAIEPLILAMSATLMASFVLAGGAAIEAQVERTVVSGRLVQSPTGDSELCLESRVAASPGIVGRGVLCENGHDVNVTVQVHGLTPGEEYTALLTYTHQPAQCGSSACGPTDLSADSSPGWPERIGGGIVSPSRTLDLRGDLHGVHLPSGTQVVLAILHHRETGAQHAQVIFVIP